MSQAPVHEQRWRIEPWDLGLSAAQAEHICQLGQELQQALSTQPEAWLVLDGWQDNPVAAWLQAQYPAWTDERHTLPDPALYGLEDMAPCLLPLHRWAQHEADAQRRENAMHDLLGRMWLDAQRRLVRQFVCGIVLTTAADVHDIFGHWLLLGRQLAPNGQDRVPFRHFDPRTLQRVWPSLSAQQRVTLLGPVHSVWQLSAPWGPWDEHNLAHHQHQLVGPGPEWHVAAGAPDVAPASTSPHRLLTPAQTRLVLSGPCGHSVWLTLVLSGHTLEQQPTAAQMNHLLLQAQQWGFERTQQWRDWVLLTWQGTH